VLAVDEDLCGRFREKLDLYIYGELPDTAALEDHLAECLPCREELDATKQALAVVDRAGLDSAPAEVVQAVISRVLGELRPAPKRLKVRRLNTVAAVAASLLVGAIGTWIFVFSAGTDSAKRADDELELAARAVAAEGESVLRLIDELEEENEILLQLLGKMENEESGFELDRKPEKKEPA